MTENTADVTAPATTPDPITLELLGWIRANSQRLALSAGGLSDTQVRTPAAPSGWTIAGLLGHVRDSTWFWLHHVVAGHPMTFTDDDAWDNDPDLPIDEVIERLLRDADAAITAVEDVASDAPPAWWPEGAWGGYRQETVRGVLLHLLNDNAAHTGHLDIAREQIDGAVRDYGPAGIRIPER